MLGIPMNETLAIGDSENDLDILRAAGTGIAMGNAPAEISSGMPTRLLCQMMKTVLLLY